MSPICSGGQYPEYISDGDVLYLSLNSSHNTDMASVVARFRVGMHVTIFVFFLSSSFNTDNIPKNIHIYSIP